MAKQSFRNKETLAHHIFRSPQACSLTWAESKQLTYKHYLFGKERSRTGNRYKLREELIFILVKLENLLQATPEPVIPGTLRKVCERSCDTTPTRGAEIVAWTPPDHCASPWLTRGSLAPM